MRAKLFVPGIAAGLLLLAGCEFEDFGGMERYHEDFHYSYPMKSGGRLAVDSFNGAVEVSTWDQETVDISGTRYARSQDTISEVRVDVDHSPDSVSVRASRPTMRNGNFGVRFVMKVPRSAVLDRIVSSNGAIRVVDTSGPARLHTSNGAIHVSSLKGELHAETSNGSLELTDVDGPVTAHTSNGGIRAKGLRAAVDVSTSNGSIDLAFDSGPVPSIKASSSNSGITLRLPAKVDARISASTSNSSITSDFEMMTRGEISKHRIEGTLGAGGPLIDLHTSNGGIRILK
jgi:hypothetical protein